MVLLQGTLQATSIPGFLVLLENIPVVVRMDISTLNVLFEDLGSLDDLQESGILVLALKWNSCHTFNESQAFY